MQFQLLLAYPLIVGEGDRDSILPAELGLSQYRAILSFISTWIVPKNLLSVADLVINFHPGSCEYPGIGCYNFAIYEKAKRFGAVCHHMDTTVDTGEIISEQLFETMADESVES